MKFKVYIYWGYPNDNIDDEIVNGSVIVSMEWGFQG
jgi:hypothetical protein